MIQDEGRLEELLGLSVEDVWVVVVGIASAIADCKVLIISWIALCVESTHSIGSTIRRAYIAYEEETATSQVPRAGTSTSCLTFGTAIVGVCNGAIGVVNITVDGSSVVDVVCRNIVVCLTGC